MMNCELRLTLAMTAGGEVVIKSNASPLTPIPSLSIMKNGSTSSVWKMRNEFIDFNKSNAKTYFAYFNTKLSPKYVSIVSGGYDGGDVCPSGGGANRSRACGEHGVVA